MKKKYNDGALKSAVAVCSNFVEVMRSLGLKPAGGTHAHLKKRIEELGLDTSHFLGSGWAQGRTSNRKNSAETYLRLQEEGEVKIKTKFLRRSLLEVGVPYVCAGCGVGDSWQGSKLVLEIDHVNGNNMDHRRGNLRFVCPNCHSQTDTFKIRNLGRASRRGDGPRLENGRVLQP